LILGSAHPYPIPKLNTMRKQSIVNQLETVIGRLSNLNYKIEGNQLQTAIREVAYVKDRLINDDLSIRKFNRKK
jgi:hypothetical protein